MPRKAVLSDRLLEPLYVEGLRRAQQLDEPFREIKRKRYEQIIEADWKRCAEAEDVLRRQASQLMSTTNAIPVYSLWVLLSMGRLPRYESVNQASAELVGMSNEKEDGEYMVRIKKIAKLLRIKVLAKRFGA
jgi:hypothetical protein